MVPGPISHLPIRWVPAPGRNLEVGHGWLEFETHPEFDLGLARADHGIGLREIVPNTCIGFHGAS